MRWRALTTAATASVVALRLVIGCTSTPELDFVGDASAAEAGDVVVSGDVAADFQDAGDADPGDDDGGDGGDARATRNTCPDAAPPLVAQCCGRVRCVGKGCDDSRCADCHVCAASSICCIKKTSAAVSCAATIAACR